MGIEGLSSYVADTYLVLDDLQAGETLEGKKHSCEALAQGENYICFQNVLSKILN